MHLKQRIDAGHCLIGAGLYTNCPEVIEYCAKGMDWIWWETQHTHVDWQGTIQGVRAAYGAGIPLLIRSWTHDGATLERMLDTGAEGIIVPMVNTKEEAESIVSRCFYPPLGNRSFGATRPEIIEADLDEWNKRIVTIMQIETPQAVENAEAIAAVPGVTGLLLGARDLALRLGKSTTQYNAEDQVASAVSHLLEACKRTGKVAAAVSLTPTALCARIAEGYRLICAGMDLDHLQESYSRMTKAAQEMLTEMSANDAEGPILCEPFATTLEY